MNRFASERGQVALAVILAVVVVLVILLVLGVL